MCVCAASNRLMASGSYAFYVLKSNTVTFQIVKFIVNDTRFYSYSNMILLVVKLEKIEALATKNRNHWERIVDAILCVYVSISFPRTWNGTIACNNVKIQYDGISTGIECISPTITTANGDHQMMLYFSIHFANRRIHVACKRLLIEMAWEEKINHRELLVCEFWNSASPLLWCIKMAKSNWNYVVMDNWDMKRIGFISFSALISHITLHKTYEANHFRKLQLFLHSNGSKPIATTMYCTHRHRWNKSPHLQQMDVKYAIKMYEN